MLTCQINISKNRKIQAIPESVKVHTRWQYGMKKHASPSRKIIGRVFISAISDIKHPIAIPQLILERSSQWLIGRNVTRRASLEHINRNSISFTVKDGEHYIKITSDMFLSYVTFETFFSKTITMSVIFCSNGNVLKENNSAKNKEIIDIVYQHVGGQASYTDFKLIFQINGFWN